MALGQVGARTEGDVYQGLFFWRQAADLLRPGSLVERVMLEHDDANGVDDVAVYYRAPGVNAGGWMASADYFQLKYHVDNRDSYTADALIQPAFINAKSSLLQRFHKAYARLTKQERIPDGDVPRHAGMGAARARCATLHFWHRTEQRRFNSRD